MSVKEVESPCKKMNKAYSSIMCVSSFIPLLYAWVTTDSLCPHQAILGDSPAPLPAPSRWLTVSAVHISIGDRVWQCPFPPLSSRNKISSRLYTVQCMTTDPWPLPSGAQKSYVEERGLQIKSKGCRKTGTTYVGGFVSSLCITWG